MCKRPIAAAAVLCAAMLLTAARAVGADWSQWCGRSDRNPVSDAIGLPARFDELPEKGAPAAPLANVKWAARLADGAWGSPVVAGGRVYVGGCEGELGAAGTGVLWCFSEADGRLLWRMRQPWIRGVYNRTFGITSTPTVEDGRVYLLGHNGEVLCLDANGMADGNGGPFTNEAALFASERSAVRAKDGESVEYTPGRPAEIGPKDADVLWTFDMVREVRCRPYNGLSGAVLLRGARAYVPTCSVATGEARNAAKRWRESGPHAGVACFSPALLAMDKTTGALLATDDGSFFEKVFHGAHASPALGAVNGADRLFYGGGNGVCYAFDPEPAASAAGAPGLLKRVWSFDCISPATYAGKPRPEHLELAEIMATPVFHANRVYAAVGNDLRRSGKKDAGPGRLVCIDASKTGDLGREALVWSFDGIRSTSTTPAIAGGLLFTADASGSIFCLDADTGRVCWTHETAPVWSSPLVADGKVFFCTHGRGVLVFKAAREKQVLCEPASKTWFDASPAVANGVLYFAAQHHLYAVQAGKRGTLAPAE